MAPEALSHRFRALVVDDEPLARANVTVLLRRDPEIDIVGECGSGVEALQAVPFHKPELLFLDVQMPECDGFDVLEQLGANLPPAVVLVTAYDQYALRAFEAGALDYLLKPFENERFYLAVDRAKQKLAPGRRPAKPDRLVIKGTGQVLFVRTSDIDWIEAADYYSCLHVGPKAHLLRRSMNELEQDLDAHIFCRIHRSTIVNLERIEGLQFNSDGEYDVLLKSGMKLRLSRGYRKHLQERLGLREVS